MQKKFHIAMQLIQWICALVLGFLAVNLICLCYHRPLKFFPTPAGVTEGLWMPGCAYIQHVEGNSITRVDRQGFMNPDLPRNKDYILMLGSSYTQGIEVSPDEKFSYLVNEALSSGDGTLHTYNIGIGGVYFPKVARHFKAASQVYADADAMIIELKDTDFSPEELEWALDQPDFDPSQTAAVLTESRSSQEKILDFLRLHVPFLRQITLQMRTFRAAQAEPSPSVSLDSPLYRDRLTQVLKTMRSQYSGPILFIYHPENLTLQPDGSLEVQNSSTWEIFSSIAQAQGFDVINTRQAYLDHYSETCTLPCGFSNTAPCAGHMNQTGHQIVADLILNYLEAQEK